MFQACHNECVSDRSGVNTYADQEGRSYLQERHAQAKILECGVADEPCPHTFVDPPEVFPDL